MLKVENNVICITRGDTAPLQLEVKDVNGNTYDFSNDQAVFTMKKNPYDKTPIIQKTFDSDGQIVLTADDTAGLIFGVYFYDVKLTSEAQETDTVIPCSLINVMPEIGW